MRGQNSMLITWHFSLANATKRLTWSVKIDMQLTLGDSMLVFRQQSGEIAANLNAALEASSVGPTHLRATITGSGYPARVARKCRLEVAATGVSRAPGSDRKERPVCRLRSTDSRSLGRQRGFAPYREHHDWSRPEGSSRIRDLDQLSAETGIPAAGAWIGRSDPDRLAPLQSPHTGGL